MNGAERIPEAVLDRSAPGRQPDRRRRLPESGIVLAAAEAARREAKEHSHA